jgi:glycosyltransferase involved in cell wall biosynthesis
MRWRASALRQTMRIAVDARELAGKPTGVGRFLREILVAWAHDPAAQAHEYVLCANDEIDLLPFAGLTIATSVRGGSGTAWEQLVLPGLVRAAGADVLLAPGYTAPLWSPVSIVLVVHDVSFAAHPEWFSWREGARRRTITRLAARRAARVVTISEFSKREIVTHLGIDAATIRVIYPGLSAPHHPPSTTPYPPPTAESVLYVGSIFNRRHVPELIEGFSRVAAMHEHVHLDIVGDDRTSPPQQLAAIVDRCGARERIHLRSYVSEEELSRLYGRAGAFAFLSDYEGFGLTPLEALGAGVPIVVLDTAVAREVYGDAAIYVARAEAPLIAEALSRALFDNAGRDRVLAAARALLPRYSWDRAARQLLDTISMATA